MISAKQIEWVKNWRSSNGGHNYQPHGHALKILEEVVELCLASGAAPEEILGTANTELDKGRTKGDIHPLHFDLIAVGEEIADVQICLAVAQIEYNLNTEAAIDTKIPVLESRTWAPDWRGVLRRPR